ncbi:cytochrome c [Tropicibacter sp. Alg240-R139]|uniref:c-type cytochrome n=1 Tax=Tropicibacter sp. Alg240-R139 TaxID=2305991 RepID=UPI0013DF0A95|nr:cytochrome c [Tropicibacter sp. Alg240-R139]
MLRRYTTLIVAIVALLGVGSATIGDTIVMQHPRVIERVNLMRSSKLALEVLGAMASGREMFNRKRANAARRALMRNTGKIASKFRRNPYDPASRARQHIWTQWADFKAQSKTARAASKGLSTRNVVTLRQTLPPMINACLSCHQTFRKRP